MSKIKETKVYNLNDFINWSNNSELEISPKYQRNSVWNIKAKSYLIDTILKGLPVPQVFMRQVVDVQTRKTRREIIDGQQRLRTILEFVNDEFKVLKSHNEYFGNMRFSDLDEEIQIEFLEYELPVEVIKTRDDSTIYDMFARVNTNNVTLNNQELRNAKYWGEFKVFVSNQAAKYRDIFIELKVFNDKQLSRMLDIEFMSTLIIGILDGVINETQKKIDDYYARYDEFFEKSEIVNEKLDEIFKIIYAIFNYPNYNIRYFHRKVYFYTLFMSLNELIYIEKIDYYSNKKNIELVSKIADFESKFDRFISETFYEAENLDNMIKFEKNHRVRTTSATEREERIKILIGFIGE